LLALGLAVMLLPAAAGNGNEFKQGREQEKRNQPYKAALSYASVLERAPGDTKARKALERVAAPALEKKLEDARELESSLRAREAIAELEKLRDLQDTLNRLGIETPDAVDVNARIEEIRASAAERFYGDAERELAEGRWSGAVASFQEIEAIRPGYRDVQDRLASVWEAWGRADLAEGRYRAAAERFLQGTAVPGGDRAALARQAATLLEQLAAYALQRGACRRAAMDLGEVLRIAPSPQTRTALLEAESCAETGLTVSLSGDPGVDIDASQLGQLRLLLRQQILSNASGFVRLAGLGLPTQAAPFHARKLPGLGGKPLTCGPYRCAVTLTALNVLRSPAEASPRQMRSSGAFGGDVSVNYQEYEESFKGLISGWIVIQDEASGHEGIPIPVRVSLQDRATWVGNSVSVLSRQDPFTYQGTTGIRFDPAFRRRQEVGAQRQDTRQRLTESLLQQFAVEAARVLLQTVDSEPAIPVPDRLPDAAPQPPANGS